MWQCNKCIIICWQEACRPDSTFIISYLASGSYLIQNPKKLVALTSGASRGTKNSWLPIAMPWVPRLQKSYHGNRRLSTRLGSKTLNALGLGGTKIKDLVVGATWRLFTPPPRQVPSGVMHLHFPWVCSLNKHKGIESFAWTPGVIFLMYLVSSGFSFKPTSSSSIILIDPV